MTHTDTLSGVDAAQVVVDLTRCGTGHSVQTISTGTNSTVTGRRYLQRLVKGVKDTSGAVLVLRAKLIVIIIIIIIFQVILTS